MDPSPTSLPPGSSTPPAHASGWASAPAVGPGGGGRPAALVIDCDTCVLQATEACGDCIVTYLCGVDAESPVVVDLSEVRAMRTLGDAGLAPPLRHRQSAVRA